MNRRNRAMGAATLLGGLIAGTIDIGAATLINGVDPIMILHAIASGVLGRASFFEGGPSAILGLVLQWAMSLIIATIYVMSCKPLPVLARRWVVGGLAYGVAIFFVMNYVVVPLSMAMARPHLPHFSPAKFAENLLAMLLFGLIVAFFAQRSTGLACVDSGKAGSMGLTSR